MKNTNKQVAYFLNGPWLVCYFVAILHVYIYIYIYRERERETERDRERQRERERSDK